jgi:hypothetical protein
MLNIEHSSHKQLSFFNKSRMKLVSEMIKIRVATPNNVEMIPRVDEPVHRISNLLLEYT